VTPRQTAQLVLTSIRRAPRTFALSVFGISVGISVLTFFLSLSLGMQRRVLGRIFPQGRIEVVPAKSSLDQGFLGGALEALSGGPQLLSDELVQKLKARPEVEAVYPRMRVSFPTSGWGGEKLLGRPVYTELIIDGIDPAAVSEETSPWAFKDHFSDKNPACTEDKNCPQGWFCSWDINKCEPPVPVIISPMLIEIYNGSIAKMHKLPRISGFLAGAMRGMTITAALGKSFIGRNQVGTLRYRHLSLVGISDRAQPFGLTVPLPYVKRWNAEYAGERAAREYSSISVQVRPGKSLTSVVQFVRQQGYTIEDNGAEQAGLAVLLITALFVLVSLSTLVVAGVNIAHTFFRAIAERRHEIGVMRAVGASQRDVLLLLLGEAAAVGLCGGVLGVLFARGVGAGIDLLSRTALPDFPFKPESYFWFSPLLLAGLLGFSLLVCLLGALWPARAAAKMSPAEALAGRS
jgi:putative ABC transport system permease protein